MIKSTELRIGNYINDAFGGRVEVRGVTKGGIWIRDNGFPGSENMFSGIPITPEYLLLLGFIKKDRAKSDFQLFFTPNQYGISLRVEGNDEYYARDSWTCSITDRDMKYVHEIQNMYFCLTGGKELQINDGLKVGEQATWKFGLISRDIVRISEDEFQIHDTSSGWSVATINKEQLPGLISGDIDLLSLDWV
jgi:hypothetical protein